MERTTTIRLCECGKRLGRYADKCKRCTRQAIDAALAEAKLVVAAGVCPFCGAGLRRNLALAGWYQCVQYGADGFRLDNAAPACSFQCFTE